MKTLDLELETGGAEMSDVRPILDAAIADHFGDGRRSTLPEFDAENR